MKKRLLLSFVFILIQFVVFAEDYRCSFVYRVATTSGEGNCSEGTDPIVKIDFENKKISFPDFVFTESKTIPEYTVTEVEITEKSDGIIEVRKDSFEINENGKNINGKKISGIIKGDDLELEVVLKVGKMPFNLKVRYFTEGVER